MVNNEKPDFLKDLERQLDVEYEKRGYLSLGRIYQKLGFNVEPTSELWYYAYIKGEGLRLLESAYIVDHDDGTIEMFDLIEPDDVTIF